MNGRCDAFQENVTGWMKVAVLAAVVVGASACEGLLEVDMPADLPAERLDNPALLGALEIGMMSDFECGYQSHARTSAGMGDELHQSTHGGGTIVFNNRTPHINEQTGSNSCNSTLGGVFRPMHTARYQAQDFYERAQSAPQGAIADLPAALGNAATVAGYSHLLLGEVFCEMTIDAGPVMTRAQVFERAEEWFTTALGHNPPADILNIALVGRARTRLNLGDAVGAVADAEQVPEGFRRMIETSLSSGRRENGMFEAINFDAVQSVSPGYRNLTVEGEPDPRVPVFDAGVLGDDGSTPLWSQLKYESLTAPFPWASWREAQLIIAEVQGGQTAVGIINHLRANVAELPWVADSHAGLPPFASNDPAEISAQVLEERRRELFLEGHRMGDMLRLGIPFPSGLNHKGEPYGPITCIPLPDREVDVNPNV